MGFLFGFWEQKGVNVCILQGFLHPAVFSHYSQWWRSPSLIQHTADPSLDTARTKRIHCHLREKLNMENNTAAAFLQYKDCRRLGDTECDEAHLTTF